jgi:anti-anti-sigma factor
MFTVKESENCISFELSSEMRNVDRVIRETKAFMTEIGNEATEGFNIVIRELLLNAIEHGNNKNKSLQVLCSVEQVKDDLFQILVEDEGKGFKHCDIDMDVPDDPEQIRHRGFSIVREFSKRIEFNDKGNIITVYVQALKETNFEVEPKEEFVLIRPSSDITASVAETFQRLLLDLSNSGQRNFRFDFMEVEDLDSVSLSIFIVLFKTLNAQEAALPKLEIINVNHDLMMLFEMTKLTELYTISPRAEEGNHES